MHSRLTGFARIAVVSILAMAAQGASDIKSLPEPLRLAIERRLALRTGRLSFRMTQDTKRGSRTCNYQGAFAGQQALITNFGDDDGVVAFDEAGNPAITSPEHFLSDGPNIWEKEIDCSHARLFPSEKGVAAPDYRALGLLPGFPGHPLETLLDETLFRADVENFTRDRCGDLECVTASYHNGNKLRWWIDSERDYAVVRTTMESNGRIVAECRSTPGLFGGYWYPKDIRFAAGGSLQTEKAFEHYEILDVQLNPPGQPEHFSPESIGIRQNETEILKLARLPDGRDAFMGGKYDGKEFVSYEELQRRIADKAGLGAPLVHEGSSASPGGKSPSCRDFENAWEAYTRRFIADHKLDAGQQNAALAILKQCQERGGKYVESHKDEIDKLDAELRDLKAAKSEPAKPLTERSAELQKRRSALTRPLDEIFEKDLKPRLEKLLTEKQRSGKE